MADWLDDPTPATKPTSKYGYGNKSVVGASKTITNDLFTSVSSTTLPVKEPLVEKTFSTYGNKNKSLPLQSQNVNIAQSISSEQIKATVKENSSKPSSVWTTKPLSTEIKTEISVVPPSESETSTLKRTTGKKTNKEETKIIARKDVDTKETNIPDKKVKGKGKNNKAISTTDINTTKTNPGGVPSNSNSESTYSLLSLPVTQPIRNRIEFDDEVLTPTSSKNSNRSKTNSLKFANIINQSYLFPLFLFSGIDTIGDISQNKSKDTINGEKKRPLFKAKIAQTIRSQTDDVMNIIPSVSSTKQNVESVSPSTVVDQAPKVSKKNVGFTHQATEATPMVSYTISNSGTSPSTSSTSSVSSRSSPNIIGSSPETESETTASGITFDDRESEQTTIAMRDAFRRVSMAPDIYHDRASLQPTNERTSIGRLSISMGRLSVLPTVNNSFTNRNSSVGLSRVSILQPRMSIMPNQVNGNSLSRRSTLGRMSIAPLAYRARESILPTSVTSPTNTTVVNNATRTNNRRTNVGFLSMKSILAEDDEDETNVVTERRTEIDLSPPSSRISFLSNHTNNHTSVGPRVSIIDDDTSSKHSRFSVSTGSVSLSSNSSSISNACRKFGPPSRVSLHSVVPASTTSSVESEESTLVSNKRESGFLNTNGVSRRSIFPRETFGIIEEDDASDNDAPAANSTEENEVACMAPLPDITENIDPFSEGFSVMLAGILEYLPSKDLLLNVPAVCSAWHAQAAHVYSWRIASNMTAQYGKTAKKNTKKAKDISKSNFSLSYDPPLNQWQPFLRAFPWGAFLSDGAYKSVFRVWNAQLKRIEAISVMDINAIAKTGNLPVIAAEIQAGCLLSHLIRTGISPNFVQTYQVFVSAYSPMEHFKALWGAPTNDNTDTKETKQEKQICPFDSNNIPSITVAESIMDKISPTGTKSNNKTKIKVVVDDNFISDPLVNRAQSILNRFRQISTKLPTSSNKNVNNNAYQFIRMELCRGGDIEGYLRRIENIVQKVEQSVELASLSTTNKLTSVKSSITSNLRDISTKYLSKLDLIAAQNARIMAFQMIYSLFTARERLYFRHYDIKLLNFFAKPATDEVIETESTPSLISMSETENTDESLNKLSSSIHTVRLRYGLGTDIYDIPLKTFANTYQEDIIEENEWINSTQMTSDEKQIYEQYSNLYRAGYIVKLADYGTADTVPATINTPVKPYHFTTLENLPPEYFILGDQAVAGYPTDTWALGLCLLHLLWGACPYEEILINVSCPPVLRKALLNLWSTPSYTVIKYIIDNDEECGKIFADTLYRYCVLLWSTSQLFTNTCSFQPDQNMVWKLLYLICSDTQYSEQLMNELSSTSINEPKGKSKTKKNVVNDAVTPSTGFPCTIKEIQSLRKIFQQDCQQYNLFKGIHPLLLRARRRAERIPGFMDVSVRMLAWSPEYRITMRDALLHTAFVPLRKLDAFNDDYNDDLQDNDKENGILTLPYVFYSREEEAEEVLPMV